MPQKQPPEEFQQMTKFAKRVMSVPKSELDKRERESREDRKRATESRKTAGLQQP